MLLFSLKKAYSSRPFFFFAFFGRWCFFLLRG